MLDIYTLKNNGDFIELLDENSMPHFRGTLPIKNMIEIICEQKHIGNKIKLEVDYYTMNKLKHPLFLQGFYINQKNEVQKLILGSSTHQSFLIKKLSDEGFVLNIENDKIIVTDWRPEI